MCLDGHAVAGALAGCGVRCADRLPAHRPTRARPYAPLVAARSPGRGTGDRRLHPADPDRQFRSDRRTLCLAAIDCHFSKRPRLAFAMLVLASLGRPEAWPFAVLYALWGWRAVPSMRLLGAGGHRAHSRVVVRDPGPHLQELVHARAISPWSQSTPVNVVHGNKFTGVIDRLAASTAGRCGSPRSTGVGLGPGAATASCWRSRGRPACGWRSRSRWRCMAYRRRPLPVRARRGGGGDRGGRGGPRARLRPAAAAPAEWRLAGARWRWSSRSWWRSPPPFASARDSLTARSTSLTPTPGRSAVWRR